MHHEPSGVTAGSCKHKPLWSSEVTRSSFNDTFLWSVFKKNTRWIYFPSLRDKALRRRSRLGFPTLKMYSHPGYDCFWGVDQTYVIQQPLLLMVQIFGQPPEISKDPLRNHGNKLLTSTGLKTPDFWSINSMSVEFAEGSNSVPPPNLPGGIDLPASAKGSFSKARLAVGLLVGWFCRCATT